MTYNQHLFEKPKGMTYTDMSIWLDNNFYNDGCDMNTAYSYIWLLSFMLACKHKYFNSIKDYEMFASMVAYDTFRRMRNKNKPKVKSALNYIKSIMPFRKMGYESERRQETINPEFNKEWDGWSYNENRRISLEKSNHQLTEKYIIELFSNLPLYIRENIPKQFKKDVLYESIYESCLLSMLNRITLKDQYKDYINNKLDNVPTFNDVKYYRKHLDSEIILWHLPSGMESLISMVINKTNNMLVNEIREIAFDSCISDIEFNTVVSSAFETGGVNEAGN